MIEREFVIEALNDALRAELSAIEIYSAHLETMPEDIIAQGVRGILEVERRHARDLTERIEALEGTPVAKGGKETVAGRAIGASSSQMSTVEMLKLELAEEHQAIKDYASYIASIMEDQETLDLLERHLRDEIDHSRWLKSQITRLSRK